MSSMKNLLPQKSSKGKNLSHDGEKTVLIAPDTPPSDKPSNRPSTSRSFSLNKILFSSATTSTHSLPVTPMTDASTYEVEESNLNGHTYLPKHEVEQQMQRSFSVPVNVKVKSLRRTDSSGCLVRVISATPRPRTDEKNVVDNATEIETACDDAAEDIPEEEAVCRICLVELGEGGETFKMDLFWYFICSPSNRLWQDIPILVMISMLAYFCFLEQLLVSDMGPRALAISLPFSCALGFISTMIASTMGKIFLLFLLLAISIFTFLVWYYFLYLLDQNRAFSGYLHRIYTLSIYAKEMDACSILSSIHKVEFSLQ
ncbi:unnamed protein product [Coffea canephora]|uniref:DH200=94 genomic scaffold, scaffold_383 n=1 Tax=Coffea canephora TaxID=49390 RepID=A0A068VF69_COFCA|nr:unnamed protein product [Coffea canephora]